jgi:hypothetical protein
MTNIYASPFAERYSSKDMLYLFSADKKFRTWRRLWIALAEAEKKLGLPVTDGQIRELKKRAEDVDYRAANVRAGYVYVISNLGSFGEGIVKVGLTRRLEPLDRVRELGDASVPFRFDVHALLFSDDAVGIEAKLHERLSDRRVNKVNLRREFFYATPVEVKEHLLEVAGDLLSFEETPEALEFHQSRSGAEQPQASEPG